MRMSVLILAFLAGVLAVAVPAGAQYDIPLSVVGAGGGGGSGGSYQLVGTVGQPAIGVMSGASYVNEVGFWYQPDWVLTGAEEDLLPTRFELGQNFPNPFNPITTFRFAVPRAARVTVKLFDVAGREVRTLVDEEMEPGYHTVPLRAEGLASGVYFCRMAAESFSETRKLLLLK